MVGYKNLNIKNHLGLILIWCRIVSWPFWWWFYWNWTKTEISPSKNLLLGFPSQNYQNYGDFRQNFQFFCYCSASFHIFFFKFYLFTTKNLTALKDGKVFEKNGPKQVDSLCYICTMTRGHFNFSFWPTGGASPPEPPRPRHSLHLPRLVDIPAKLISWRIRDGVPTSRVVC